jgi:lysophospholipase L1-like esterase
MHKTHTYLALGDSYTIGEAVPLIKTFPYQAVNMLRKKEQLFSAPEIIAKTGWTTDELAGAIDAHSFLKEYDFVTLLIGVNNQYRGREVEEYKMEFENLLKKAIAFAGGKTEKVIILSIPDYSVTPFAQEKDPGKISHEIDLYNSVNRALATQYKVHYIDITEGTREAKNNASLLAEDGLHPSEKEYKRWAEKLSEYILSFLKK